VIVALIRIDPDEDWAGCFECPPQLRRDSPRQSYAERLLAIADKNLAGPEAKQEMSNPKVERPLVHAQCHIIGQPLVKFGDYE
jgi:hypothetical protein